MTLWFRGRVIKTSQPRFQTGYQVYFQLEEEQCPPNNRTRKSKQEINRRKVRRKAAQCRLVMNKSLLEGKNLQKVVEVKQNQSNQSILRTNLRISNCKKLALKS